MDVALLLLQLVIDTSVSWGRMFAALFLSIIISYAVGIWMATSSVAERLLLPILDIFQTLPILAFFPLALYVFVVLLPPVIGVNSAVVFLIITSMVWNMIFGVYESIKTMPHEFAEVANLYGMTFTQKLRKIYMPGALPRLVDQSILSWSIGLFYLVTSEIFSVGTCATCSEQVTYGIGVELVNLASGPIVYYLMAIAVFIVFVILTRFLFFRPLENYASRYMKGVVPPRRPWRTSYERGVERFLRRYAEYARTAMTRQPFTVVYNRIRNSGKAVNNTRKRLTPEVRTEIDPKIVYGILGLMFVCIVGYLLYANHYLVNYEWMVLYSLAFSFARVWLAFLLIVVISIPLVVYLVFILKQSRRYLLLFQIIASIPATVLLPLIAIEFDSFPYKGEFVAFVIFFLSGLWYVIFGMLSNGSTLPNTIFEVKNIFGVKGVNAWKNIYLKALLPGLITGALTGIAAEWNASIVAEFFSYSGIGGSASTAITSVSMGIGLLLDNALANNNIVLMGVAIINMTAMIVIINTLVWKRLYRNVSRIYR